MTKRDLRKPLKQIDELIELQNSKINGEPSDFQKGILYGLKQAKETFKQPLVYREGDILELEVNSEFCGLPVGMHTGVVVNLIDGGLSVAFTDTDLAARADMLGTVQFLNVDALGNCDEIYMKYLGQGEVFEVY